MFAIGDLQQTGSNMNWLWVVLLLIVIALILWWFFARGKDEQVVVTPQAPVRVDEKKSPDDLTKLEGIGPKVAKVLSEAGINTFAALAAANASDVQAALNAAGLQMMNSEGWIEQAKLAAVGDWKALEKLQGELKGGRRK